MPTHAGPNPALDSNIIFSYDVGDTSNSYRGEPTVNIAADLGLVSVALSSITYIGIEDGWKKYGLSGTWSSGTYPYAIALTPVTFTGGLPYCVRATVKTNVPNKFNYFGANGISYVNEPKDYEGTLSSTLNPDGSYTVTRYNFAYTNTTAQAGYLFTNPVDGATFNSSTDFVWVKEYQAEQKDHPTQFVNGTRSVTQGLLPLISNTTINLSNVSFTSNAQITYDGTDDHIDLGNLGTIGTTYSIECVFNSSNVVNYRNVFDMNYATYSGVTGNVGPRLEQYSDGTITVIWSGVTNNNSIAVNTPVTPISANTNYHMVFTQDGNKGSIYLNGVYKSQNSNTYGYIQTFGDANLGRGFELTGDRYFAGSLPLFKIYNQALSADQIKQNYQQYKSRFNLS